MDALRGFTTYMALEPETGDSETLIAHLTYDSRDPHAFVLEAAEAGVAATFDRCLLDQGRYDLAHGGAVAVSPTPEHDRLWITVDGRAFRVRRTLVDWALSRSYELVPLGEEGARIDWDGAFAALLGGAS
ncbi:SsgA family sporulation/cell division regulator [Sphaerisporangium sp. NPDC004334]